MHSAQLGITLKSISLFLAAFIFLFTVPYPPLGFVQLVRADVSYSLAVVSSVCLFVPCRRYLYSALAVAAVLAALSFIYPNLALPYLSRIFYLGWGWLGLLWAGWRLGKLRGVAIVYVLQMASAVFPTPSLRFANLLPDWVLYILGDDPEKTFFNWARFLLTYISAVATLLAVYKLFKRRVS
jgi:hypothetical protein